MKEINSVALIDTAHIFRSKWHSSADQELSAAYDYTVNKIHDIAEKSGGYDAVVCCIDAPPYNRTTFYPDYKGNRPETAPEMHEQYKRVQEKLASFGYHIWKHKGFEADDVIAAGVKHAKALNVEVDIHTGDKDLMQLVDDEKNIRIISTRSGDTINAEAVREKLGVGPESVVDFLALTGDKADNIPGADGIGPKTASAIINSYERFADMLVDAAEGRPIRGTKGKAEEKLRSSILAVQQSKTLVTLVDDIDVPWGDLYKESGEKMGEMADELTDRHINAEPNLDIDMSDNEALQNAIVDRAQAQQAQAMIASSLALEKQPLAIPAKDSQVSLAGPASIELRPGVSVTSAQYELFKTMAKDFHNSGLYKRKYGNDQSIFTVMLLGLELGVSPQVACQNFHIIEGKPTPAAHFLIGLAKRDSDCEFFECSDITNDSVTYACKKKSYPKELTFTYTLQDAADDGQRWAKNKKNQKAMLRKTAGSQAARLWFPEACSGLYSQEEMGFEPTED